MSDTNGLAHVVIEHWDSPRYGGGAQHHAGMTFTAELTDQREGGGRLMVSIADDNGEIDNQLTAAFEITDLPGSRAPVAVLMLYDGDEAVAKLIRQPNGHLVVPMKPGLQIVPTRLPNGDGGWMILEP